MLHGILFILKIIGLLLLVVIGLLVGVMLLALLVPVRYRLKASVLERKPDVDVRVTWLLHLLSVRFRYHLGELPFDVSVKLFGFRLTGRKKRQEKGKSVESSEEEFFGIEDPEKDLEEKGFEFEENDFEIEQSETEGLEPEDFSVFSETEDLDAESAEEKTENSTKVDSREFGVKRDEPLRKTTDEDEIGNSYQMPEDEEETEEPFSDDSAKHTPFEKLRLLIEKIVNILRGIPDSVEKLQEGVEKIVEKKNSLMEFVRDADNQSLFRLLLRQTGGVFRHIRPRKLRLYLHFGFTDPSLTGKLLGYASVFYAYYYKTIELVPEFQTDTLILEGNLYARGRVRAGTLLCKGIRLLFNKGCRKLIRKALKK